MAPLRWVWTTARRTTHAIRLWSCSDGSVPRDTTTNKTLKCRSEAPPRPIHPPHHHTENTGMRDEPRRYLSVAVVTAIHIATASKGVISTFAAHHTPQPFICRILPQSERKPCRLPSLSPFPSSATRTVRTEHAACYEQTHLLRRSTSDKCKRVMRSIHRWREPKESGLISTEYEQIITVYNRNSTKHL
jgi:hypothetical protein